LQIAIYLLATRSHFAIHILYLDSYQHDNAQRMCEQVAILVLAVC